jgi:outer membrane receptor protein involved in Fe transport
VFYKHFDKPIEALFNYSSGGASSFNYQNADKAKSYGAELEIRKKLDMVDLLKNFTLQGNFSYIDSKVESAKFDLNRPLQGQSPYVINVGLLYDQEATGWNATLLFNQIGQRIAFVGDASLDYPDIYEAGRALLDFQLAKKIFRKKGELRLNVSDILNKTRYFYQNVNDKESFQRSTDARRFERKFGTTFSIAFNYSIF